MDVNRRKFVCAVGLTAAGSLAGCSKDIPEDAVKDLPSPTRGPDDAPVTIELFEDYQCPHCRDFNEEVFPRLISNHTSTGEAQIEFHDFPLPVGDFSWKAAMAARSVQDRAGNEAFWTYEKFLFDNQSQMGWSLLREAANELDLDGDAIVEDARNNMYRPVVQKDKDYGNAKGAGATPAVFVDGSLIKPPENGGYDEYYQKISSAIADGQ